MAGLIIGKRGTLKCSPSNCCKILISKRIIFVFTPHYSTSDPVRWMCQKPSLLNWNVCFKILTSCWAASFRTDQRYQSLLCYLKVDKINAWTVTSIWSLSKRYFYLPFIHCKGILSSKKVLVWILLLFEISFNLNVVILVSTATAIVLKIYLTKSKYFFPVFLWHCSHLTYELKISLSW